MNMPENKLKCPACKTWVVQAKVPVAVERPEGAAEDGTVLLSKVTSAEASRVHVGCWDPIWGGGIVTTSTTLLGGTPGAGKSTVLLQIADIVAAAFNPREVLYVAAEECLPEVRLRADRLGIVNMDFFRMVPAMKGVDNLTEIFLTYRPALIVLDSLQGLSGEDHAMQLQLCKVTKEYAIELQCPIIIISHVNKGGDLSGFNDLQHEVDTTIVLTGESDGLRDFTVKKNRFGPNATLYCEMTATGLVLVNADGPDDPEDPSNGTSDDEDEEGDDEEDDEDEVEEEPTPRRARASKSKPSKVTRPALRSDKKDDELF
jgi:DNA repair protein RadA/Sms